MKLTGENIKRKNPINRNNLYTDSDETKFFWGISSEYINNVLNQTVVLYQIDREKTKINDVYQEAKYDDIVWKTPIEINVMYNLESAELKTYDTDKIKGFYLKSGQLKFQVMLKELEENECDIQRGDYIGLQVTPEHMEYFIVTDDGRMNFDNKHTMWGTVPYYRNVVCAIVTDKTETQNI